MSTPELWRHPWDKVLNRLSNNSELESVGLWHKLLRINNKHVYVTSVTPKGMRLKSLKMLEDTLTLQLFFQSLVELR